MTALEWVRYAGRLRRPRLPPDRPVDADPHRNPGRLPPASSRSPDGGVARLPTEDRMTEERTDELDAVKRDRARLIAELHGAHRERDSLLAELAAMTRYADAQVGASMRAATELRSLRGVVQAVEALAEKWADGDEVSEWNPLDELRAALGGSCVCGARPSSSPAALAAAADAPQPSDDDEGIAHVTETYRQTISGWEQLGWECVTCGRLEFVVAGPGMGKAVPAADLALLERLAAKHVREASAGPSPAVLPQPSEDQR